MHLLELIAALGAVQGLLLSLLILFRFRHHKNLPLALLLLVFSLRLGTIPSWNPDTLAALPWLYPLTAPLPFLFGPLLWWYVRELAAEEDATPPLIFLLFVPYLAEVTMVAYSVVTRSPAEFARLLESIFGGNPPLWLPVRNGFKVALNVIYVALSVRIAFGERLVGIGRARRIWLRSLAVTPIASLIPFGFVAVYSRASARLAEGATLPFLILAAAMALLVYTFSLLVLVCPDAPACGGVPGRRRSLGPVPVEECMRIARLVQKRLADGVFRDPDVSLTQLAAELKVHPNRLSLALNQVYNEPFRRLLNRYRLEYFVEQLRMGALERENILGLAFDAGFPSKSTFHRVFKEQYGVTPSTYATGLENDSGFFTP